MISNVITVGPDAHVDDEVPSAIAAMRECLILVIELPAGANGEPPRRPSWWQQIRWHDPAMLPAARLPARKGQSAPRALRA